MMRHGTLFTVMLLAVAAAFQSCSREELPEQEKGICLSVGEYPTYEDTRTIGTPDPGKSAWADGDTIRIIFQTESKPVAARFNLVREAGAWKQETPVAPTEFPCRALAFYAPAYEFGKGDVLSLKNGHVPGLEEFFEWKSGEDYDITDPSAALAITFKRAYSRLRVASEPGGTVTMESAQFIPAGYGTSAIAAEPLSAPTDSNGNAFFFGKWADGTAFKFTSYDAEGGYAFNEYFPSRPSGTDGKSYAISCINDGTYINIAQIAAKAEKTAKSFSGKVRNVVVSYVIGPYAHLEDGSGAVLVYLSSHGLSAGQRINGSISGKVKSYNNSPEITSLTYSSATVTSDGVIPCTEMTLERLLSDFDANLNRRILLKGITIDQGTTKGSKTTRTGQISQSGSTIAIYATYTNKPAELTAGLTGDLIAYPMYYNDTKQLSIYESGQFTEAEEPEGEETPFTKLTLMGYYTATDTESPVPARVYEEGSDQYSATKSSSAMGWNLFNPEKGTYMFIRLASVSVTTGKTVNAEINTDGATISKSVTVVKKTGTNAWLEDKTGHEGFVISLK